jgi:hypothetical protein
LRPGATPILPRLSAVSFKSQDAQNGRAVWVGVGAPFTHATRHTARRARCERPEKSSAATSVEKLICHKLGLNLKLKLSRGWLRVILDPRLSHPGRGADTCSVGRTCREDIVAV